jgi:hypothetical protein
MTVLVFVHGGGFFGGSANSVDGSLLVSTATKIVCPPGEPRLRSEQTFRLCVCTVSSGDSGLPVNHTSLIPRDDRHLYVGYRAVSLEKV